MLTDEKIALLKRQKRQLIREAREKAHTGRETKGGETESSLTLLKAAEGIELGRLALDGGKALEFEPYLVAKYDLPVIILKDFYAGCEERENSAAFANPEKEVSQMLMWRDVEEHPKTVGRWRELLVSGMETAEIHIKVLREEELECLEYICYEAPTGKGWLYNIIFRARHVDWTLMGNYNCQKTDRFTYGLVLESMIRKLNEVIKNRLGGKEE